MPATIKIRWAVIRRIAGARDSDAEHGLHRVPRDRHEAVDLRFVDDQRRREEDRVADRGMRAGHGPHARDDTAFGHLLLDARPDLLVEREAALARPVLDQLDGGEEAFAAADVAGVGMILERRLQPVYRRVPILAAF